MQSKEKNNLVFIRLFPDEEINEKINEACKKHNVKTAVVLSGLGQFKKVKLGYFKSRGDYSPEIFEQPTELLTLSGNICRKKDEYILHLHTAVGDEKKNVKGGHLIEGIVSITAEIVILKSDIEISRKYNDTTGLMNLNLD
jgi:predicted DNA-binding protein with PD1-like motif